MFILNFFHTILYVPTYNLLIFFAGIIPHGDVGLAIIALVVVIRIIIFPLSISMVHTQRAMQLVNPEVKALQEKYKNDKEKLAKETFALYKKYKINPFASILVLIIQLPILFTLYFIVRSKSLYMVSTSLLYPFVHVPAVLSPVFLGIFVLSSPNLVLAFLSAATQFLYGYYGIPIPAATPKDPSKPGTPASMQEEFGRAVSLQSRYVFPILYGVISYTSGAIAVYFITTNIINLLQFGFARLTTRSLKTSSVDS